MLHQKNQSLHSLSNSSWRISASPLWPTIYWRKQFRTGRENKIASGGITTNPLWPTIYRRKQFRTGRNNKIAIGEIPASPLWRAIYRWKQFRRNRPIYRKNKIESEGIPKVLGQKSTLPRHLPEEKV